MVFGGTWHPVLLASGITAAIFSFGELGRLSKAVDPGHVANPSWAARKGKRFLCGSPGLLQGGSCCGQHPVQNLRCGFGTSYGWKQREGKHLTFENCSKAQ